MLLLSTGLQGFVAVIAAEAGSELLEEWAAAISPFALVDTINGHLLRGESVFMGVDRSWVMGAGFLGVWVALVAACWGVLALRYRKVGVS